MSDAAYWDNWADAIGPARLLPSPSGRGAGGEGRQQRRSSHSRMQPKAIRIGIRAKISPHPCRRPRGSLPPPGPPLAIFPVRVGGPAGLRPPIVSSRLGAYNDVSLIGKNVLNVG